MKTTITLLLVLCASATVRAEEDVPRFGAPVVDYRGHSIIYARPYPISVTYHLGLEVEDQIRAVGEKPVELTADVEREVLRIRMGDPITITFYRNGKGTCTVSTVMIGKREIEEKLRTATDQSLQERSRETREQNKVACEEQWRIAKEREDAAKAQQASPATLDAEAPVQSPPEVLGPRAEKTGGGTVTAKTQKERKQKPPPKKPSKEEQEAQALAAMRESGACGDKPPPRAYPRGYIPNIEYQLKKVAHDPDSIEIVECSDPEFTVLCWYVECLYRGKNVLGVKVLNKTAFFITKNGMIPAKLKR